MSMNLYNNGRFSLFDILSLRAERSSLQVNWRLLRRLKPPRKDRYRFVWTTPPGVRVAFLSEFYKQFHFFRKPM
jgi:hypothetical protein